MKIKAAWLASFWFLPLLLLAQSPAGPAPAIPTMDHEPHHHLALHNDYVKVFNVLVNPGDSIILHSHDQDTVAIAIGDQLVTVGIPGKTVPPSKNADGQVRLQRGGYVHSTHVDGDTPYHTVAVELMQQQTNFHNVCGEVLSGQPLNCPENSKKSSDVSSSESLLESDQTRVRLIKVRPGKKISIGDAKDSQVIVALDPAALSAADKGGSDQMLKPGDFVWFANGGPARQYGNRSDKETRFLEIVFTPAR